MDVLQELLSSNLFNVVAIGLLYLGLKQLTTKQTTDLADSYKQLIERNTKIIDERSERLVTLEKSISDMNIRLTNVYEDYLATIRKVQDRVDALGVEMSYAKEYMKNDK